jgi:hypothetical protein
MTPIGSRKWLPAHIGGPVTCHNAHFWSSRHCIGTDRLRSNPSSAELHVPTAHVHLSPGIRVHWHQHRPSPRRVRCS